MKKQLMIKNLGNSKSWNKLLRHITLIILPSTIAVSRMVGNSRSQAVTIKNWPIRKRLELLNTWSGESAKATSTGATHCYPAGQSYQGDRFGGHRPASKPLLGMPLCWEALLSRPCHYVHQQGQADHHSQGDPTLEGECHCLVFLPARAHGCSWDNGCIRNTYETSLELGVAKKRVLAQKDTKVLYNVISSI